jgi:hypothetical protein
LQHVLPQAKRSFLIDDPFKAQQGFAQLSIHILFLGIAVFLRVSSQVKSALISVNAQLFRKCHATTKAIKFIVDERWRRASRPFNTVLADCFSSRHAALFLVNLFFNHVGQDWGISSG